MKYTITNLQTQQTFEFTKEEFLKKLASFLLLFERDKSYLQKNRIFSVAKEDGIVQYESCGFKFLVLPVNK